MGWQHRRVSAHAPSLQPCDFSNDETGIHAAKAEGIAQGKIHPPLQSLFPGQIEHIDIFDRIRQVQSGRDHVMDNGLAGNDGFHGPCCAQHMAGRRLGG